MPMQINHKNYFERTKKMKKAKRLIVLFLGLCLLFSLGACNAGTSGTSASPATASAGAATSTAPDSAAPPSEAPAAAALRIGLDGEPKSLNFIDSGGNQGAGFYNYACYDRLWMYTSDGELHYLLGTNYEYSADNTTLTIKIRDDAKFSNGDPVTAADVLFTLVYSDAANPMRTSAIDLPNSKAADDTTLVLALKMRTASMIEDLAILGIGSAKWTENGKNDDHINVNVVSSGPYYLPNGWTTGSKMELEKNPNYYGKDSLKYDKFTVNFVPEENTRYLQFTTGDFDLVYLQDSKNIDTVRSDANFTLLQAPFQCNVGFVMDTENQPTFQNLDLRLAICYAVDVQTIVKEICGSAYKPATSLLPSTSWAYKNTEYGYNPELAKDYYAKSGVKDFTFNMLYMDTPLNNSVAEAMQAYLAEIGITMTLQAVDAPSFFKAMMSPEGLPCTITQYMGSNDPGGLMNPWLSSSPGKMNHPSPDIQALLDKAALSAASKEERIVMFADLQDQIKAYGKILPFFEMTANYAEIKGVDASKTIQADGFLVPYFF